mgnify:CR=1 FL=1
MTWGDSFVVTARRLRRGQFSAEPGKARFLIVPPDDNNAEPAQAVPRKRWSEAVIAAGHTHQDPHNGDDCGDIAVLVHGYNTSPAGSLSLHRRLYRGLVDAGFAGALVSFDWPSDDRAINYLEDRTDAKLTALRLVDDFINLLVSARYARCRINVHVIAHSMGAYVLREAFDDADDRARLAESNWTISQLCLVAGDVSSASLAADDARSRSLYRHCTRLTNYSNAYDRALKLSNIKRIGVAPRAGRRGLPTGAPEKASNVDCSDYFREHYGESGDIGHSWYFDDAGFVRDLAESLSGDSAPDVTGSRRMAPGGHILLA